MAFTFSKSLCGNAQTQRAMGAQLIEANNIRRTFNNAQGRHAQVVPDQAMAANAAARIPADVYREMDAQATAIFRAPNQTLLMDLMPLAKSLPVGKILHEYRQSSDAGLVTSSISGQVPANLDKTKYEYDGAIVVIHSAGYGREWREWQGQQSEGFDGLLDDNANTTRAVADAVVDHLYNGTGITFKGVDAYGIKNSANTQIANLGTGGLEVDLTSSAATAEAIRNAVTALVYTLRTDNNINMDLTMYISREIEENWQRYFSTSDIAFGTILENVKRLAGVADVKVDASLNGNEVILLALDSQYIQPLVGMAASTVPLMRNQPFDNYNFLVWTAVGLQIRADYTGKSGVLYAYEVA